MLEALIEAFDAATNVKTATFDNETKEWTITYKNGYKPDVVNSLDLLNFLENG
jgi:cation diffusion facilitator CzcD-associated flavoprotein CzcO